MSTINQDALNTTIVKYWSLLILITTGILAIVLYKERVIYADSALQVFEMINSSTFSIYVERYSMYISQLLPVALIKSEAPLSFVLMSYSISGVLIHLICFILCFYFFKNKESVIFLISFIIMYRHAYFHAISETYFSIAYSALFYACINYFMNNPRSSRILFYLIAFVLIVLNYFMHPITFFLLSFVVCFTALNLKSYKTPELYILLLFIALVFISKFLFTSNGHENNYYAELKSADILNSLLHSNSFYFLQEFIKTIYLLPAILFVVTIALYALDKQYITAAFIMGMVFFFIAVNAITFNKGDSTLVMETRFAPLYFFICIPLFNLLLKKPPLFYIGLTIVTIQIVATFISIQEISELLFQRRMNELISPLKKHPEKKFLIYSRDIPQEKDLVVVWASSVETLLYTSIEGKEYSKTLFISNEDPNIDNPSNREEGLFMFVPWWQYYGTDKLSSNYFGISKEPYKIIRSLD